MFEIGFFMNMRRSTAKAAAENINAINEGSIHIRQAQDWFAKFKSGNFNLNDAQRSGRPSVIDETLLEELVTADPRLSSEHMANILDCSTTTIKNHLHMIGKSYRAGVWVPHDLTEKNKTYRLSVCKSLILKNSS